MNTDDEIRAAWNATKEDHQPVYDELPHPTRALLRHRADLLLGSGLSGDEAFDAFERKLLDEPKADSQPSDESVTPLPVDVVEELIAEAVPDEPVAEPEPEVPSPEEPVAEELVPKKTRKKPTVKKTAKKLAEKKASKKPAKKVATKKVAKRAAKKATKK